MPYKDREIKKIYYTVGDVAKMFNVAPSLVRYWDSEFKELKPSKNKKGNRLFHEKDIEYFKVIYYLVKVKGYTLDGARTQLKNKKSSVFQEEEVISKLQKIKAFLLDIKNQME